jgi:hypothetical protein
MDFSTMPLWAIKKWADIDIRTKRRPGDPPLPEYPVPENARETVIAARKYLSDNDLLKK